MDFFAWNTVYFCIQCKRFKNIAKSLDRENILCYYYLGKNNMWKEETPVSRLIDNVDRQRVT